MTDADRLAADAETLTPLQRAFLALEDAEARLQAVEETAREPIAIIGLGCRVPGGGDDPAGFWRLLRDGIDAIGQVPADRWNVDALYDPDPETPGCIATRSGGFLKAIDQFDPAFFGIAPREAQSMDPQQRLMLEVSWEALDHAGQAPDRLANSLTGVFMGVCSSDYTYLQIKARDPALLNAHFTSGIAHSIVTGRLSYLLGLQGPSVTIDTACSSSLVAIHLACQALRNGECSMALAGGVNLILAPDVFIGLSHARMLAPDGRCKTFDAAADGFARGEGCGIVVLKRLSDAQAAGDRILALVRGSAVQQDGPSSGLTAPNGPAQEAVIREALKRAGVTPNEVGFIEAHGTGTELGDPLEVRALGEVFGAGRDPARPLLVGSVKTNIGHLEAAAGVVGLIKLVLSLQYRTIPQHLHFRTPSPHIAWDWPVRVPTQSLAWEPIDGRRLAGVSSFGFSGTNAHIVLEEAAPAPASEPAPVERARLLAVSARDPVALAELGGRLAAAVTGRREEELADICHTANCGRAHFSHRATITARTIDELRRGLASLARGEEMPGLRTAQTVRRDPPRIAFLFSGQGAQYAGMAKGLYEASPVFRDALQRCTRHLDRYLDPPLLDVLFGTDERTSLIGETAYTQPALFAVEYALAELWRSWGVVPNIVMGHSLGEYAAACLAGVIELEDALRLVARRGALMQSLPPGGAMAAVFAPPECVSAVIAPYAARVSIAAINAPNQVVISGGAEDVNAVCRIFAAQNIRQQSLTVSHAFHSPLVDPVLDRFEEDAKAINFSAPRLRLVSNLTGELAAPSGIMQAQYWRRHMREPVRFADGLRTLDALRPDLVVEIGPHPTLLSFAAAASHLATLPLVPSLRKGRDDWEQMMEGLARVYLAGAPVDWRGVDAGSSHRIVELPSYPFQRARYWFQAREIASSAARGRTSGNPILGTRLRIAAPGAIFEALVTADAPGFVRQHRVLDHVIMPAAAFLDSLLASGRELLGSDAVCVEDVVISEAMLFDDDGTPRVVQTVAGASVDGVISVAIHSLRDGADEAERWVEHVRATLRLAEVHRPAELSLPQLRDLCRESVTVDEFYAGFAQRGVDFGEGFRVVRQLWRGEAQALGEIELGPDFAGQISLHRIHPVLLDGCLQLIAAALPHDENNDILYLPIGIGRLVLCRNPGAKCWGHVRVEGGTGEFRRAHLRLLDSDGVIGELDQLQLQRVSRSAMDRLGDRRLDECLYDTQWYAAPFEGEPPAPSDGRDWLIFADRGGVAAGIASRLRGRGERCTLVGRGAFLLLADASQIDPASAADYRLLIEGLRTRGRRVQGVIHAWSLDIGTGEGQSASQLVRAQEHGAASTMLLAQALVNESQAPRLWLLTRGAQQVDENDVTLAPAQAPILGFGKSLALEHPELRSVCIDLDPRGHPAEAEALEAELAEPDLEREVAWRHGQRLAPRLVRLRHAAADAHRARDEFPWRLVPERGGTLDRFNLEASERRLPAAGEVEIAVAASGVNFRDVLSVLGLYPGDPGPLGGECAGRVVAVGSGVTHVRPGDEVLAVAAGTLASHVTARAELVQLRPAEMSREEAASFSIAFLTAEFCLSHLAGMREGDRVLIHAGAGGVGMAAIKLAQNAGVEVYATAGSPWKRELLRSMGVAHVMDSRSTGFADEILTRTNGRGVDLILNSLSGELIDASFKALAHGGRFVEIGKRGVKDPSWVGALNRDIRYFIVDWSAIAAKDPALIGGMLAHLVGEFQAGRLAALPRHVFPIEQAGHAFRFMATASHAGKIVLVNDRPMPVRIRRDGTYLVTGGLSGLGLAVAGWLAQQGAGRLVLVSRRGETPEVSASLAALRAHGSIVVAEAVDVADAAALGALLQVVGKDGPPLRGVIHSAGVLDDCGLLQQDSTRFGRVLEPKLQGGLLLDQLTARDPLDFFVLFSSIASVLGSPGQTNYAAANAFLDALARQRRTRGLPSLSVNWCAWTNAGMAADRGIVARLAAQGMGSLTPEQGTAVFGHLLNATQPQIIVMPIDARRFAEHFGAHPLLKVLSGGAAVTPSHGAGTPTQVFNLRAQLAGAPAARRRPIIAALVRERALRVLGAPLGQAVDPRAALRELGLDSLLAVELRNVLSSAIDAPLPATLLFEYPSIEALTDYLARKVLNDEDEEEDSRREDPAPEESSSTSMVESVEQLSDEEVDRLLAARAAEASR